MSEIDDLLNELDDEPEDTSVVVSPIQEKTQVEVLPANYRPSVEVANQAEPPVIDVREQVQRANATSEEILASWRSDRCEAQGAANFVKSILDNIVSAGDRPSAGLLEQYIKALEVKASTNQTAVKCVDAIAKLLAATKQGGPSVQNNTLLAGNSGRELIDILTRPVSSNDP